MKNEPLSLYQITEGINKVEAFIDDETALAEYLDSLDLQFTEKVSDILRYSRSLKLTSDAVSSEIDRLTQLKKYYDRKEQNLKNYISDSMQKTGKEVLELEIAKLSFRKSETTEIDDALLIPKEYLITKTTQSPDKTKIKADLKNGIEIPGAHIESHKSLQIK